MGRQKKGVPAAVQPVEPYLEGVAKCLVDRLYGPDGLPWGTKLEELVDTVDAVRKLLSEKMLAKALERQAQSGPRPEAFVNCSGCGGPVDDKPDAEPRNVHTRVGEAEWDEPHCYCRKCRQAFSPQSKSLGIDRGEYSVALLDKIVYVGTMSRSFERASKDLAKLAEVDVPAKQVERVCQRIGGERVAGRDEAVSAYQQLPLTRRKQAPPGVTPPDLAVVGCDGGRLQILERSGAKVEAEEADAAAEGRRGKHWREDKVGLLQAMKGVVSASDPCPEVPESFVDPTRILKLARELKGQAVPSEEAAHEAPEPGAGVEALAERPLAYEPPEVIEKRFAGSRVRWPDFGPILATMAWQWGFFAASRKAFIGDGSDNNWAIWRNHFSSFVPILDFIHALSYVFAAAMAGRKFAAGWPIYQRWIGWVWQGEVARVIAALARRQLELGTPQEEDGETNARQVVAQALTYLQNHQGQMRYAAYRQQGLPITSSYVESAVKQFNQRVKGTEMFWSEQGAEAMLQLRADHLSSDEPLAEFWQTRQARQTGQRPYRKVG